MLFCSAFSVQFYILYLLCGFSDTIDGTIARKTDSISEFGFIKIGNIIWGFINKKKLISLHTFMNKATGVLLFLLPLTLYNPVPYFRIDIKIRNSYTP